MHVDLLKYSCMQWSKVHGCLLGPENNSIMEAVKLDPRKNAQDNHDWVSEFSLVLHENQFIGESIFDIEVLCIVYNGSSCGAALPQV